MGRRQAQKKSQQPECTLPSQESNNEKVSVKVTDITVHYSLENNIQLIASHSDNLFIIYQAEMPNICWLVFLKNVFPSVLYNSSQNAVDLYKFKYSI